MGSHLGDGLDRKAKKVLLSGLIASLFFTGLSSVYSSAPATAAACSSVASSYGGGAGTLAEPFQISSAAHLIRLSATSADWTGKYYIQTASIDLGSCDWTPIGTAATKFTGSYDGQGNAINNLSINILSGSIDNVGLFGVISGATIKNLIIRGEITSNRNNTGALVGTGTAIALSQISQIRSEVNIANTGGGYAGGIVGDAMGVAVSYSSYSGSISASNEYGQIAGISGYNSGATNAKVSSSYVRATISGASAYKSAIGAWNNLTAHQVYAVTPGSNSGVSNSNSTVTSVFWNTTVGPATATRTGAITGATGKTTSEMVLRSTYSNASWDIVDGWDVFTTTAPAKIWGICPQVNNGYPYLLWEYASNPCLSAASAPVVTAITAGNAQASVAFTVPTSDGGSAVSNYKYSTDNGATWTAASPAVTTSPLVISGLTNGTSYPIKILAVNAVGDGAESNAISATPVAPPQSSYGARPKPSLTNFVSKSLPFNKAQSLILPGERLSQVSEVWLGPIKLNISRLTDAELAVTIPALLSGVHDLKLVSLYGVEILYDSAFAVAAKPVFVLEKKIMFSNLVSDRSTLSSSVRNSIASNTRNVAGVTRLVCTGSTSGSQVTSFDKKLALSRAKAACAAAKKASPAATVELLARPASGLGKKFRSVELKIYTTK